MIRPASGTAVALAGNALNSQVRRDRYHVPFPGRATPTRRATVRLLIHHDRHSLQLR